MDIPIAQIITGASTIAVIAIGWGKLSGKQKAQDAQIAKNEEAIKTKVTKEECKVTHDRFCDKLAEIKDDLKEIERKREAASQKHAEELESINHFMGRVDQFMRTQ